MSRAGPGLLALALLACGGQEATEPSDRDVSQAIEAWRAGAPIPDVPLVDHQGNGFWLSALDERYVLLSFIFTRCPQPDACPMTVRRMRQVKQAWADDGPEDDLHLLLITLDPQWDTPERLQAWAQAQGVELDGAWTLATGEEALVTQELPSLFNVLALPAGPTEIRHTVRAVLLAPGRQPVKHWTDNAFEPEEVLGAAENR